jgi:hypothetical protein
VKRSPLKRRTSMRRSWMRRRSPRRIARETPAEREHKRMIREARCCAMSRYAGAGSCWGPLEVAHLGPSGGVGRKHGDWTQTTLLCRRHHQEHDQRRGVFGAMPADELAAWREREIHLAREFVAGRLAVAR